MVGMKETISSPRGVSGVWLSRMSILPELDIGSWAGRLDSLTGWIDDQGVVSPLGLALSSKSTLLTQIRVVIGGLCFLRLNACSSTLLNLACKERGM